MYEVMTYIAGTCDYRTNLSLPALNVRGLHSDYHVRHDMSFKKRK